MTLEDVLRAIKKRNQEPFEVSPEDFAALQADRERRFGHHEGWVPSDTLVMGSFVDVPVVTRERVK